MDSINNHNQLFAKTSPLKLFFKAAIPGAIGMAASNIYYISEALFVGRLLGEASFAAMNLALPLILINFALADLIGVGSSVHLAIKLGEGDNEGANRMFSVAVVLIFLLTTAMSAFLYFFSPFIFALMGAESEIIELATDYLRVYAIFTPITGYVFAFDNYLRICGKIEKSMFLNIFMAVVSVIIEFIFMYFLALPLPFAALGTSLGMSITAIVAMWPFLRGKMTLRFRKLAYDKEAIKSMFTAGSPAFLNNMAGRVFSILMNSLLLRMGGAAAISVYGIIMNAEGIILPVLYGICDSLQPAVGYNLGAGNIKRVKALEKCCFIAAAIVSVLFSISMIVFSNGVTRIFLGGNMDDAFMSMASIAIILFGIGYFVRWISYAAQSFFSAIGDSVKAVIVSIGTAFVFPLISIPILWKLGLNGLYLNSTLTAVFAAVMSVFLLMKVMKNLNNTKTKGVI